MVGVALSANRQKFEHIQNVLQAEKERRQFPGQKSKKSFIRMSLHCWPWVSPGILWGRHIDQLRSTSVAPVLLEPASEPALVPAQEEERGNAKAEVRATLHLSRPQPKMHSFDRKYRQTGPASPAPVENQAAATTPAPTAERRHPPWQREQRAPQRLNY